MNNLYNHFNFHLSNKYINHAKYLNLHLDIFTIAELINRAD